MARVRQRFPPPDGWTSKGERIRDQYGNPVGLGLIQTEGDLMAKAKDEVARGADVPLVLAAQTSTRDALVDPQPGDYIPDVDTKGYHIGEVRQPAEPVLHRSGEVTFESLGDTGESKFVSSYKADFDALEERVQSDPAYEGTVHVPITGDPEEADRQHAARKAEAAKAGPTSPRASTSSRAIGDLDADSARVAKAQTAEDKSDK